MPPLTAEPEEQDETTGQDEFQSPIDEQSISKFTGAYENHSGMAQTNRLTDYLSDSNKRSQGNLSIKGSTPILEDNPALHSKRTTASTESNPIPGSARTTTSQTQQIADQAADQVADTVTDNLKNTAKKSLKKAAAAQAQVLKQAVAAGVKSLLAALAPYAIPIIIALVIIILAIVIFVALMGRQGNTAKQVGVNMSGRLNATVHCKEMVDTIKIPTRNGKSSILLTLHETSGGFSEEGGATLDPTGMPVMGDPANNDYMKGAEEDLGDRFAMSSELKEKGIKMEDLAFYATARWMFKGSYLLDDLKIQSRGLPAKKYFAGQKVMFYNPKNKKAAIAIITEVGPAAHLRDRFAGGPAKGAYDKYNAKHHTSYKSLGDVLDVTSGEQVVMSFLDPAIAKTEQGKLGLTTCTEVQKTVASSTKVTNDSSYNNTGTPKFIPGIPPVGQKVGSEVCNKAVGVMAVLRYKPNAAGDLVNPQQNSYPLVKESGFCSTTVDSINTLLAGVKDSSGRSITYRPMMRAVSARDIKASIDKGDPVVAVMGKNSLLSSGQHFVLVVGYDDTSFYINDPFPWSDGTIHIYTNRGHNAPNKPLLFNDFVNDMQPEQEGGYYYAIMRK